MVTRAVLCYVFNDNKVLLARKNKGFGVGKINAPGGKIEKDEDIFNAARRELMEEAGITPLNLKYRGILLFFFGKDKLKPDWIVYVLTANKFVGSIKESDEIKPFWIDIDKIPYENMWEDDRYWLPWLLNNRLFKGVFVFDETASKLLKASVLEIDEKELLIYLDKR